MTRCKICGGRVVEDVVAGIFVCKKCGTGWTCSGRKICRECLEGNCDFCESWRDGECSHECILQGYYGSVEDIGFIAAGDY